MDKYQAEKIINKYGAAIANDESVFKKKSSLPCSKAKIRYAFYVYLQAIINDFGKLPEKAGDDLVLTYSMLDSFMSERDINRLNKISEKIKNKQLNAENPEDKKQMDEWLLLATNALRNGNYFDEINEYIEECYKENELRNR